MGRLATQVDEPVFLYELAIELDMRSIELAEDAARLGIGAVGPTSELTRDQVTALRAAGHRSPVEQALASRDSGAALAAPAGWGTAMEHESPVAMPLAPPSPPPPPPPPVPAPDEVTAPTLTNPGPLPPPPPPLASSTPPSAPPWGPPASAPPTGPPVTGDEEGRWRDAPGQIAVVAAVLVLVIGLFVFMAVKSGRNDDRRERRASAEPTTTASGGGFSTTDPAGPPRDRTTYCAGAPGLTRFMIDVGGLGRDLKSSRSIASRGHRELDRSFADLRAGSPRDLDEDLASLEHILGSTLNAVDDATSLENLRQRIGAVEDDDAPRILDRVFVSIKDSCGR